MGLKKHHYEQSGGDGILVDLFQILKDDAVKVLHSTEIQTPIALSPENQRVLVSAGPAVYRAQALAVCSQDSPH